MNYNSKSDLGKLRKTAEINTEKYRKLGMNEEAIKELIEFDLEQYKSDRRFYSHIYEVPDKTADEIADEVPTYDTYFFESEDTFEFVDDERLKKIIKNAKKNEKRLLYLIVKGYSRVEISRILKISKSGISKMLCKMRNGFC